MSAIGVLGVVVSVEVTDVDKVVVPVLVAVLEAQRVSNPPQQSPLSRQLGSQKHVVRRVVPGRGGAKIGVGSLHLPSQSPTSSRNTVVVVVGEVDNDDDLDVVGLEEVVLGDVVGVVDGIPEQK